ncbi:hypothetical protein L3Q82_006386 [Scortum barcoo]|uniref:Uncharacterized protein n=1 Tax=Scortum barcoo TaxID=214431 RepID=A0ACB8WZN3_9TELE|nr:hypothetical protein L3Q82_006386 [Scortum barcoo]
MAWLSWGAISKPTPARRQLTLGNSRVVEGPAPLKELGSRAQAMRGAVPLLIPENNILFFLGTQEVCLFKALVWMMVVESALTKKPGGDRIMKEYIRTKGLTDSSRRQMVNILAADMTEIHGMAPPQHVREMYACGIVALFPYLMDPYSKNGYIEQDFILLFGEEIAAKFLKRWPTTFKQKVIQQSKALPTSSDLEELIHCAEAPSYEEEMDADTLASSGTSIQEHVDSIKSATQPYLLAVGMKRSTVHEFFIVLDKQVIPCKSTTSLAAFDELFKAHFVFGTMYSQMLHNMYTFIQTTVYNIDVGKVQESPRVAEMRARMLH